MKWIMDWEKAGGAAFPIDTHADTPLHAEPGMSLRDYFAGQAIAGLCVSESFKRHADSNAMQAQWAYDIADAMLRVRECKPAQAEGDEHAPTV